MYYRQYAESADNADSTARCVWSQKKGTIVDTCLIVFI